jgi:tetratricopeptide (TPR) repeat protein
MTSRIHGALLAAALGLGCATSSGPAQDELVQLERQAQAKYNLGIDHLDNGRTALALRELLAAEQLNPQDPWTQFALAEAYRRSNLPQEAIAHLERTMQLDPDLQSARLNLSGVYIQMGDYANAARHAQILVDDPTFATPWRALTNLGWAQLRTGQAREARRNLELAIGYHPRYWPALLNLGILEAGEGRRLEAIAYFQRVVESKPGPLATAEAHYRIAETLIALGQQEKAFRHLAAVAEIQPNGPWGPKSEEYLKLLQ